MAEDLNTADVNDITAIDDLPSLGDIERSGDPQVSEQKQDTSESQTSSSKEEAGNVSGQKEETSPTGGVDSDKPEGEGAVSSEGTGDDPPEVKEGAKAPTITDSQRNDLLSEMTGGSVVTQKDLGAVLGHYQELRTWAEKVKENPKMLLPEGKAQSVFDFVMKQPGENYTGSIQKYYHVLGLGESKDLSPKQAQFEAYMLREENSDLSREDGKRYFDAKYDKQYGDDMDNLKEEDPLLYREYEVATNQARKQISETQAQFETETAKGTEGQQQPYSEEEYNEFVGQIETALDDYGGVAVAFEKDAKPEDRINFVLDDPEERQQFTDYLKDPGSWWEDTMAQHIDDKGNLDTDGYRDAMLVRMFPEKFAEVMYKQGWKRGMIANEADIKNASDSDRGVTPGLSPSKGLYDSFGEALEQAG